MKQLLIMCLKEIQTKVTYVVSAWMLKYYLLRLVIMVNKRKVDLKTDYYERII